MTINSLCAEVVVSVVDGCVEAVNWVADGYIRGGGGVVFVVWRRIRLWAVGDFGDVDVVNMSGGGGGVSTVSWEGQGCCMADGVGELLLSIVESGIVF